MSGEDTRTAQFTNLSSSNSDPVMVQFNPASLQYQASTQLHEKRVGSQNQQAAQTLSAQLTLELVFDTTDTGDNVAEKTAALLLLMRPGDQNVVPKVRFAWERFRFEGYITQFRETIDFFSDQGRPLRSSVSLTLQQPKTEFDRNATNTASGEPTASNAAGNNDAGGNGARGNNAGGSSDDGSQLPLGDARSAEPAGRTVRSDAVPAAPGASGPNTSGGAGGELRAGMGLNASAGAAFGAFAGGSIGAGGAAQLGAGLRTTGATSAGVTGSAGAFAGLRVRAAGAVSMSASASAKASARAPLGYSAEITAETVFAPGGLVVARGSASGRVGRGER